MWDPAFEVEDSQAEEASTFNSDAALVHRALELLHGEFEENTWQAFWRMVAGERASDIAADLGMSTKAVRQAKYRVLRRLRGLGVNGVARARRLLEAEVDVTGAR